VALSSLAPLLGRDADAIAVRAIAGMMVGIALMDAHDPEPLHRNHRVEAVAREVARLILHGLQAPSVQAGRGRPETGAEMR
jgi:hypothetical protein